MTFDCSNDFIQVHPLCQLPNWWIMNLDSQVIKSASNLASFISILCIPVFFVCNTEFSILFFILACTFLQIFRVMETFRFPVFIRDYFLVFFPWAMFLSLASQFKCWPSYTVCLSFSSLSSSSLQSKSPGNMSRIFMTITMSTMMKKTRMRWPIRSNVSAIFQL